MIAVHIPVLLKETIEGLLEGGGEAFIDCTVGTAGHLLALLSQTNDDVMVIGIDKDNKSLEVARERLKDFGDRVTLLFGGFEDIDTLIEPLKPPPIAGILFDLGMSSFQLNNPQRGFSYREDGPLDMRFNSAQSLSASELINESSQENLLQLLRKFSEDKWFRRLSRVIVERRDKEAFKTTVELSDFIRRNIPRQAAHKTLARVFQALRITVNNELENLKTGLVKAFNLLKIDGRIAVISYHSLEDRIVKNFFGILKEAELAVTGHQRCIRPSKDERMSNRRSRSARLRVINKRAELTNQVIPDELETVHESDMEGNG